MDEELHADGETEMGPYEDLLMRIKDTYLLQSAAGVIGWDLETYMPPRGIALRSEQLALLEKIRHQMVTSSEFSSILSQAEKEADNLDEVGRRNLFLTRRYHDIAVKTPSELVGKIAQQQAVAVDTWKKAKAANDWKMFKPELEKMIELSTERYEIAKEVKGSKTLYDAMLDDFERNMTTSLITKVFSQLREGLVPLAAKCAESSVDVETSFLEKRIPIEIQRKIATDLGNLIEYDTTSKQAGGRIDETEHPFTSGYYSDVRVTVHYHENNLTSLIYAMLHEGGHALYEQNLNPDWQYQPVGNAASFGIHESMSRFVENVFGRTPQFWEYYLPRLNDFTAGMFADIGPLDFAKAVNLVKPSKIRIEADEVTYSLHVIIRFEIERDLFANRISVSELPQVWNEKYEEYLGVEVNNDSEGVMQDTHWASGYYGYFPSYALGNVYDGQWVQQMSKDMPDWMNHINKGQFGPIKHWLVDNVMHRASLFDPGDLVKLVTGNELDAQPFLDFIGRKYSQIYGF
ncbi:MAG: carboxypeptidase M32 [Candidatus Thorarchaeota archaeon]|nr:carboxypeptidase M32 [Candidatus Thorarchaeota archaeon]